MTPVALQADQKHIPVMLPEVLEALQLVEGETYVDGTFGGGGYTRAILNAAKCRVVAIDRDPDAIARSASVAADYDGRFSIIEGCFGDMAQLVASAEDGPVSGVVLDIGVSSFQLDEAERGFSFQSNGPLDMRMAKDGLSAADVVNSFGEAEIANILYEYGEERKSRRIAAAIVKDREETPFETTRQLASLVERVLGMPPRKKGQKAVHPATRTFQALRIYVNDELGELKRGLEGAERLLAAGGRLVVVSFHSLEDRIVKAFLQKRAGRLPSGSRHMPGPVEAGPKPSFTMKANSAIKPSKDEQDVNPRSRSARLRVAVRTDAPAWAEEQGHA